MELVTEKVNFEYDLDRITINDDMSNKLFCTFSTESDLDNTLQVIQSKYNIIYNKIFVLYAKSQDEYICTYNVDFGGVLDTSYKINWSDYRNCILLTKGSELKRINTKLFRIIELDN